jgi:hypothetical protein
MTSCAASALSVDTDVRYAPVWGSEHVRFRFFAIRRNQPNLVRVMVLLIRPLLRVTPLCLKERKSCVVCYSVLC